MGRARRRTTLPLLGVGALLVMLSVAVFGVMTNRLDDRTPVLVLSRPVTVGQVIGEADLRVVPMSGATEVGVVSAADVRQVVGRTAAVALPAGSVLTRAMLGEAAFPPAGQRLVSLSLKAGQYPQRLAAGARVEVYLGIAPAGAVQPAAGSASDAGTASVPVSVTATVVEADVDAAAVDGGSGAVVTLLLTDVAASRLAGAAGSVLLMQMPAGV